MVHHPAAFINAIAEEGTKEEAVRFLQEYWNKYRDIREPLRNVDQNDWDHLFKMLPESGHGQFWKAVLTELRAALARNR